MIYNKYICDLTPFLPRSSQSLWNFLSVEGGGVSFAVLMSDFGTEEGQAACWWDQPRDDSMGTFKATPRPPGRGDAWRSSSITDDCHQILKSCLWREDSTNTQKDWFRELLGRSTLEMLGEWCSQTGHGGSNHTPFPIPCPTQFFCLALPELCPFIINW